MLPGSMPLSPSPAPRPPTVFAQESALLISQPSPNTDRIASKWPGTFTSLWKGIRSEASGFWRAVSDAPDEDKVGNKRPRRDDDDERVEWVGMGATPDTNTDRNVPCVGGDRTKRRRTDTGTIVQGETSLSSKSPAGQISRQKQVNPPLRSALSVSPGRRRASRSPKKTKRRAGRQPEAHVHFELPAPETVSHATAASREPVAAALLGSSAFQAVAESWRSARLGAVEEAQAGETSAEAQRRIAELEAEVQRLRSEVSSALVGRLSKLTPRSWKAITCTSVSISQESQPSCRTTTATSTAATATSTAAAGPPDGKLARTSPPDHARPSQRDVQYGEHAQASGNVFHRRSVFPRHERLLERDEDLQATESS